MTPDAHFDVGTQEPTALIVYPPPGHLMTPPILFDFCLIMTSS